MQNLLQTGDEIEIAFKGLFCAVRIVDRDVSRLEADEGERHCDAVIAERSDRPAANGSGRDGEGILAIERRDPQRSQILNNGMDAVTFLRADVLQPRKTGGRARKGGKRSDRERLIGKILQILFKAVEPMDGGAISKEPALRLRKADVAPLQKA